MKNLFIIVHPDDESIGCGALIRHFKNIGDTNYIAVMSCQTFTSLRKNNEVITTDSRVKNLEKSLKILNDSDNFNVFCMSSLSNIDEYDIVKFIDTMTIKYEPDRVFMPWKSNHHDHRITHECCLSSTRVGTHNKSVKSYYFYDYPFYQFDNVYGQTYIELDNSDIDAVIESCKVYEDIIDKNTLFSVNGIKHRYESIGYEIGKEFCIKVVLFKTQLI